MNNRIRVLYVEGESALPEKGKAFLEKDGVFALDTCASPTAALQLLQERSYDAVVTGYRMPSMDGIGLLKQVRARDPAIPFIIVTGHGSEKAAMEALNNGADYYLKKSGDLDTICTDLGRALRRSVLDRQAPGAPGAPEAHRDAGRVPAAGVLPDTGGNLQESDPLSEKERVLQESEETFRAMVEQSGEGIIIVDFFGMLRFANQKAWDIIEYPLDRRITDKFNILEIVAPELRVSAVRDFLQVSRGIDSYQVNYKIITADKKEKWLDCIGKKISYKGSPAMLLSFRDTTERRRSEWVLKGSEEKFRTIFDKSPYPICMNSMPEGRFMAVNAAFLDSSGYAEEEVLGKTPLELGLLPLTAIGQLTVHFVTKGRIEDVPLALTGKGGRKIHVRFSTTPITVSGRPAILTVTAETTKLKRVEAELIRKNEELRESEERLALVMNGVPTLISYHDAETRFVYVNKAHEEWYGRTGKDLVGKSLNEVLPEDVYARALPYYRKVLDGQEVSFESPTLDRDGQVRVLHVRLVPHVHGTMVIGFFAALEDITLRKKAEEALRESEEKYRALVETTSDFIWEVDERGVYTYASPKVRDLLGYEPAGLIGKTPFDFMPAGEAERVGAEFQRCVASRLPISALENRNLRRDGSIVTLETSGVPRFDDRGRFLGYRGIDRDITERRDLESAFQAIVSSMVGTTGMESLDRITENVASWLGADCVMIGEILPDKQRVRVLSMVLDGSHVTDFSYTLKGTPCENVAENGYCIYPADAAGLFPAAKDLSELSIQGYVGTPLRNTDGTVIGILCVLTRCPLQAPLNLQQIIDLIAVKAAAEIERKNALQALQESEERFRMLLQHVPSVAVQGYAMDGTTQYWNEASERLYGYTAEEAVGKNLVDLIIPPEMRDEVRGAIKYMAETGQPIPASELSLMRKDGSRVALFSSHAIVRKSNGSLELFCIDIDLSDRKRAEEALLDEMTKRKILIDRSRDGIVTLDESGKVYEANRRFADMLGYTPEEMRELHVWDWDHQYSREQILEMIRTIQAGGAHFETRHSRKDGSVIDVELSNNAAVFSGKKLIMCVVRDITERKRMEEALRENRQMLSEAMDLAQLANWEYDVKGGVFIFDDRFYAMFATTAEREGGNRMPAGVYAREFIHPDDRAALREEMEKAQNAPGTHYVAQREHRIVRRDGVIRHVVVRIEVTKDADGRILKARGVNQDITERKQAEEALRESEEHYRSLAEQVHDGIFIYQGNRFVFVNTLICKLTGYSKDELMGMDFFDLVHPDDRAYVQHIAERRARGEQVPDLYEIRVVRKDGAVRYAELALSIILMKGGYAVLGAGRDITERRQAEEALRQANRKLTMLNSITRHDILNQLTALLGYIEFSKEDITDPALLEYVEKEDQAAKAIRSQIEFTRSYQDIGTQEPRWQGLHGVIRAGVQQLKTSGVAIDAGINTMEIFADPLLEKVFYNLMENSLRHGGRVTRMTFSCRETGNGLVISYADDGVGISVKDKQNLFKRGFGKHTGLGLFLSREILAITGITIAENGEPGKGVQFEITVPDGKWRRGQAG